MLTNGTAPVDAVMRRVSEIAARDGVSKQAVSKKVKALVREHGLSVETDPRGHVRKVDVVQYDQLRGLTEDPSKRQAPAKDDEPPPVNESYNEALRVKTWHEARRRELDLERERGNLVKLQEMAAGLEACAEQIGQVVDRLPNVTDDLANVVAREGSHGLRRALRKVASDLRGDIANVIAELLKQHRADRQTESEAA